VVHIEQRALRAFERKPVPGSHYAIQAIRHVGDHRFQPGCQRKRFVDHLLRGHRSRHLEIALEDEVVQIECLAHELGDVARVEQILRAHGPPCDLVFVGRADAAPGRADLRLAAPRFARLVERDVVRKDQRAIAADRQPRRRRDAATFQFVDFREGSAGGDNTTPLPM
jgi:hypothetical protein